MTYTINTQTLTLAAFKYLDTTVTKDIEAIETARITEISKTYPDAEAIESYNRLLAPMYEVQKILKEATQC